MTIDEDDSVCELRYQFESSESDDFDIVRKVARENFGIEYLFPWQRLVIANILDAFDIRTNDFESEDDLLENYSEDSFVKGKQIVLLPTGAGKSLCFLVPACILDGVTLVIYPLLALMSDQMRRMQDGSLKCVMFRGGQTKQERDEIFLQIADGAKVIIANPEVLQSEGLLRRLKEVRICHVAIDEAHCVSEWGDSFRPAYLTLGKILKELAPPVVTAFTATASPSVLSRISEILFGGNAHIVRSESDRPNIHYFVRRVAAKQKEAIFLTQTELRPMIIFCGKRSRTEEMSRELNACFGNEFSRFYHAGLTREEKTEIENWFFNSKDGVLCATCAYGMGVDKKDIKTVVHLDAPQTAEAYIQEAGRGGRDGSVAKGILLWSLEDDLRTSHFPKDSREAALREFANTNDCRRQVLLDSLGAEKTACSGCDLCNLRMAKRKSKSMNLYKRKKFLNKFMPPVPDYEIAFSMIKKSPHFYDNEKIEKKFLERMNLWSVNRIGKKIWTHGDVQDVIQNLEMSGKIKKSKFFWKNCYSSSSSDSASAG